MSLKKLIQKLASVPKLLFLLDGMGALLSWVLLAFILPGMSEWVGLDVETLKLLSYFPLVYMIYDFACFLMATKRWLIFVPAIIIFNVSYCIITVLVLLTYRNELGTLGWLYFAGELFIIAVLVRIEYSVYKEIKRRENA